jgi:hypothetical protein
MTNGSASDASKCLLCGRRLRNAVFCPICGSSLCSWVCYIKHIAEHALLKGAKTDGDVPHKIGGRPLAGGTGGGKSSAPTIHPSSGLAGSMKDL